MRIRVPLNQKQTIPATGGVIQFDFARVASQAMIAGKHVHIRDIRIKLNLAIKQAAASPAVFGIDQPAMVTGVDLVRDASDPATQMYSAVPGDCIQLLDFMRSSGVQSHVLGTDVSAGGPLTSPRVVNLHLRLDEPYSQGPDDHVWPLAAFSNGYLRVTVGNIASVFGDGKLSLDTTATNDVDVELICVTKDRLNPGVDRRISIKTDSSNTTKTGIRFDAGRYESLIYFPQKLNGSGGENCFSIVSSINSAQGGQPIMFPSDLTGDDYNQIYFGSGGYLALQDSASPLGNGKCVVLASDAPFASVHQEVFTPSDDFSLDVTLSSTLTANHRFIVSRIFAPRKVEDQRIASKAGLTSFVANPKTASGGKLATASRMALVPRELVATAPVRK